MNALKVLLLAGMTVLILLTPQPAAAQSVGCNLIYQAGDDPNAEPQDGDCPKVLPALGSAVALTTALIVYGLILRHGYLSGASTSAEEGGERALKEGVDEAANRAAGGSDDLVKSIRHVNPTGGKTNCVNCVVATDSTLSGAPASALPSGVKKISELENLYGTKFKSVSGRPEIERILAEAGEGSRGIVFGGRGPNEAGHVFNAINQNGVVRFLDGQSGTTASFRGFASFRFLRTG